MSGHMPYIHAGDPAYAPPVLRAPSPSSSIGTDYDEDETPQEELRLSEEVFAKMCEDKLKLGQPRPDEIKANEDPLLPRPRSQEEEQKLFIVVMQNLRQEVRNLEENNIFEQTVLRGSLVTEELQPTADIDAIMRSMMGPEISSPFSTGGDPFSPRPNFAPSNFAPSSVAQSDTVMYRDFIVEPTSPIASTPAVSKLRPRSKGKARRT